MQVNLKGQTADWLSFWLLKPIVGEETTNQKDKIKTKISKKRIKRKKKKKKKKGKRGGRTEQWGWAFWFRRHWFVLCTHLHYI